MFLPPSSQFPSSPGATDGPVRRGDALLIKVGAFTWPIEMSLHALTDYLRASGISDDLEIEYSPTSLNIGALLIISGHAADNWQSGSALCVEILKLIHSAGFAFDLNRLSCVITPVAPTSLRFEIPNWLLLLALGFGLWWLWRNRE